MVVPSATIKVAKKCRRGPTRGMPKSMIPRKPASRKKAVSTSYPNSEPITGPASCANFAKFVPNSNAITMPVTTPTPKPMAKMPSQKR